jgi:hypothetical protein
MYKGRSGGAVEFLIFDFESDSWRLTRLSSEKVLRGKEKGRQKKFPTAERFGKVRNGAD